MTPGPKHTITLSINATGVFLDSMSRGALVDAIRKTLMDPAVANSRLDATGNVFIVHDELTDVDIHVTVTRTSMRHL